MFRILYVHPIIESNLAGTAKVLLTLLKHIDKNEVSPIVVCSEGNPIVSELRKINIGFEEFKPCYISSSLSRRKLADFIIMVARLVYFAKRKKINIIHANNTGAFQYSIIASKILGIRCVLHDLTILHHKLERINQILYNSADKIVAVSNAVKQNLVELGIKKEKIKVVYAGVELFDSLRNITGQNNLRVGLIGRVIQQKGCECFIKAMPQVLQMVPQTDFLIIGDDQLDIAYSDYLRNLVMKLAVKDRIIFTGYKENIVELINSLDIIVLPTLRDSFPRVLLEAMTLGKPVVATDIDGCQEIVKDKVSGLLVPVNDHRALSQAIIELLNDENRRKEMGYQGKERVKIFFSPQRHVQEILRVYEEIV